jgi:transcriptional regulator with XRE-family HTH domain
MPTPAKTQLAEAMVKRMAELSLNQTRLSREADVSTATIRKLTQGDEQNYERKTIYQLARVLGFDAEAMYALANGRDAQRELVQDTGEKVQPPPDDGDVLAEMERGLQFLADEVERMQKAVRRQRRRL